MLSGAGAREWHPAIAHAHTSCAQPGVSQSGPTGVAAVQLMI